MVKRAAKKTYTFASTLVLFATRLAILALIVTVAYSVYRRLLSDLFNNDGVIVPFVLLWLLTAYVVLPRLHRWLTKLYIPDYFVGRTRTGDGLLGDPVNVAFIGTEKQLHAAMQAAGWTMADDLNWRSSVKMTKSSILKKSYPTAPVSSLYLFGRKQDFAYQQEINNNPHARHHVRFWKIPDNWWLPGGHEADWIAAGTYDKSVGFSTLTGQITHKIEENTDEERDYIIKTLKDAKKIKELEVVKHFTTAFRSRNGGGDSIETDGSLPFVTLK